MKLPSLMVRTEAGGMVLALEAGDKVMRRGFPGVETTMADGWGSRRPLGPTWRGLDQKL